MSVPCFPSELGAGTVWWREQLEQLSMNTAVHCSWSPNSTDLYFWYKRHSRAIWRLEFSSNVNTEQRAKEDSAWWAEEIGHAPSLELDIWQILTSIAIAANKCYDNSSSLTHVTDHVFFVFSIRLCSFQLLCLQQISDSCFLPLGNTRAIFMMSQFFKQKTRLGYFVSIGINIPLGVVIDLELLNTAHWLLFWFHWVHHFLKVQYHV